ncbi:MAG TPA: hypothetical protein VMS17_18620 [Gemmataceae bacterium]|nr:hypothetical protein [Gemmataceae bacterium]
MNWLRTETVCKGLFLGLVLYAGLETAAVPPGDKTWVSFAWVNLSALAGLAIALVIAAGIRLREGFRVRGKPHLFLLFLLLESPWLVYVGVFAGLVFGIVWVHQGGSILEDASLLWMLAGGAGLGVVFCLLRQVPRRLARLVYGFLLFAGMAGGVLFWLDQFSFFGQLPYLNTALDQSPTIQIAFSVQILAGMGLFYVLILAGREDESEADVAAVCGGLAVAIGVYSRTLFDPENLAHVGYLLYLIPAVLYVGYAFRALPWLRVVKHAFRGMSFAQVRSFRRSLQSYRRALALDPKNKLALQGMWNVHRALDINALANDPQTLALVDLDLCLDRAGSLLVQGKPNEAQLHEANRLLDVVLGLQPQMQPPIDYWRAVSHTHTRQFDEAAAELTRLLDPVHYGRDNAQRRSVLFQAWQLALTLSETLRQRVGLPQLAQQGRRMEAIAAVERRLAEINGDEAAWGMKRLLYSELTEAEYFDTMGDAAVTGSGDHATTAPRTFDYSYVQQLGLSLINDDAQWQRGGAYLRMAAHGMPMLGPTLFLQIAQAQQRVGRTEEARHNLELAKRAGRSIGAKSLAEAERTAYFAVVKQLAELAQSSGDLDAAIENLHLYAESERSGLETLRTLADLYERKGDALMALRVTEQGLLYSSRDKDLIARKDRYYYSVMPDDLRARIDLIRNAFDFDYCMRRARTVLDGRLASDAEWMDVASHLIQLAMVVKPASLTAKVLYVRLRLRYGERDEAVALLEHVREPKPERFDSGEDEEAWYQACQILGDIYLEGGKPDMAVKCLTEYRKSAKSGARTLYKLGQAYEKLGDRAHAVKAYEMVTAYDGNPLVYDARSALHRLQQAS